MLVTFKERMILAGVMTAIAFVIIGMWVIGGGFSPWLALVATVAFALFAFTFQVASYHFHRWSHARSHSKDAR